MGILESKDPLGDVDAGLQRESGNPVDFNMHPNRRMPDVQYTTVVKGKEGTSSPIQGTKITKALDDGQTKEDAEAARNRALKQGKAGV